MIKNNLITIEQITTKIYHIRGIKVMLDRDLASLYGVETKYLKQAVRRNINRFPDDFMFELSKAQELSLRSQNATLKRGQHSKYLSFAFTEQGVAMLSSILKSDRAIQVNIQIMRTFTKLRHMISEHEELRKAVDELKQQTDERFEIVFSVLDKLLADDEKPKKIGF
ncbi:MAG: ORF6N domain-containing protein [Deltaproteobacteria bacterium]|jgi:phage regulator Rha-like protein|nr:ORF6N domain-containing protein [Deltaproteobacteria bacterium]